jgi:hypothetical protein
MMFVNTPLSRLCLTGFGYMLFLITGLHCGSSGEKYVLQHNDIQNYREMRWEKDSTLLVMACNTELLTRPLSLKKGKYSLFFKAEGTASKNELPHFVISVGPYIIKDLHIASGTNSYNFKFELPETLDSSLKLTFDNDYLDSVSDRNIFLTYPVIVKSF